VVPAVSSPENSDLGRGGSARFVSENARRGKFLNGDEPRSGTVAQFAVRLSLMAATMPPDKEGLWASDWLCTRPR
jgi:hypothetical protein